MRSHSEGAASHKYDGTTPVKLFEPRRRRMRFVNVLSPTGTVPVKRLYVSPLHPKTEVGSDESSHTSLMSVGVRTGTRGSSTRSARPARCRSNRFHKGACATKETQSAFKQSCFTYTRWEITHSSAKPVQALRALGMVPARPFEYMCTTPVQVQLEPVGS